MLEAHLAQAERHVAEGESHVARQKQIVMALVGDARDLRNARELLMQFEAMLTNHLADRDRIRVELAATK